MHTPGKAHCRAMVARSVTTCGMCGTDVGEHDTVLRVLEQASPCVALSLIAFFAVVVRVGWCGRNTCGAGSGPVGRVINRWMGERQAAGAYPLLATGFVGLRQACVCSVLSVGAR